MALSLPNHELLVAHSSALGSGADGVCCALSGRGSAFDNLGAGSSLVVVCCSFKALSLASSIDKAAIFLFASI